MLEFKKFRPQLAFFVCLIAVNGGLFVWAWLSSYTIVSENGPIEYIQVLILSLAFVSYVLLFSKQDGAAQTLVAVLCLLCVFIILKELDFKELYWPGYPTLTAESIMHERIRKLLILFTILLLIVFLIVRIKDMPTIAKAMFSWHAWPFYLYFALLILGQLLESPGFRPPEGLTQLERNRASVDFHRALNLRIFWEELSELNAYLVLLYAAHSSTVFSSLFGGYDKIQSKYYDQH